MPFSAMRLPLALCTLLLASQASAGCWKVKANSTLTTRPAYTITNGVLAKSKERAPVGATCDTRNWPTKPSGKDLYASYDSTDKVALCSKR